MIYLELYKLIAANNKNEEFKEISQRIRREEKNRTKSYIKLLRLRRELFTQTMKLEN